MFLTCAGSNYWRYNFISSSVDPGYPKSLSVWNGIGTKIDAAFQFENKVTYFFTNGEYRRFDDNNFQVAVDYPRRSTRWLKCEEEMAMVVSPDPTPDDGMMTMVTDDESRGSKDALSVLALYVCLIFSVMQLDNYIGI